MRVESCPDCSGPTVRVLLDEDVPSILGDIHVKDVPVDVCTQCGAQWLSEDGFAVHTAAMRAAGVNCK